MKNHKIVLYNKYLTLFSNLCKNKIDFIVLNKNRIQMSSIKIFFFFFLGKQ